MAKKKKATAKKKPATKKSASKPASKKSTKAKTSKPRPVTSVDGVLKKYEKERAAQDSQLVALRKKIEELETKARVFEEQIAKLKDQESSTENAIAQLDSKRDEEVSRVLSKLGVSLGSANSDSYSAAPDDVDDEVDSDEEDSNNEHDSDGNEGESENDSDSDDNAE